MAHNLNLGDIAELQATLSVRQLELFTNGTPAQIYDELKEVYVERVKLLAGRQVQWFTPADMALVLLLLFRMKRNRDDIVLSLFQVIDDACVEHDDLDVDEDEEEDDGESEVSEG